MITYKTAEIAHCNGIHPNTVRLYEELALIPKPERTPNGYRIFTDFHMEQIKLVRTALQVEVLQNGLRKMAIEIIKTSARYT
ncbi:MerR family DNA-binding transcriptional regulator [Paenibacillus thiaminolyticus]|uniref:MerR family DNA-binding transcriptional regulator n=1 Tax=Paenibacillus thiaminolyticus TaxID=49283 RepID=UPI003D26F48F